MHQLHRGRTSQRQLSWIESVMIKLEAETGLSLTSGDCQRWCPELARFSFYTRDLARTSDKPLPRVS